MSGPTVRRRRSPEVSDIDVRRGVRHLVEQHGRDAKAVLMERISRGHASAGNDNKVLWERMKAMVEQMDGWMKSIDDLRTRAEKARFLADRIGHEGVAKDLTQMAEELDKRAVQLERDIARTAAPTITRKHVEFHIRAVLDRALGSATISTQAR